MQYTRKLAAIFSSDVFGYSRLMGDDEQATLEAIVDTRQVMAGHIARHGGRVVDATGDALLAQFASAVEAVRCALAIQDELALKNATRAEHRRMHLRIGLNVGDVIEQDGALYGDGVNIAARVQTIGEPGGVCVTGSVRDQVLAKLPLRFEAVGERVFKNIARPVQAFHLRSGADAIASQKGNAAGVPARAEPVRNNLPRLHSSFVGRLVHIATVRQQLAEQHLVTLVGPGGIGKTRLALQVGHELLSEFADGVWLVGLESLADARLLPLAVASVLGIKEDAGRPVLEALLTTLQERRALIVLDNCEHLLQACADLMRELLRSAPCAKVLATSREALRVTGEVTFAVPALATPDAGQVLPLDALVKHEALQLFVDRAVAAAPAFELTAKNLAAVADICRRLDGIPLAIELAAARVRALSVENIATRLSDRFHLLTHGDRGAMPRQQTLRALIDWSHDLFSDAERALFRRLAVFAGGWTLEAAEAVAADDTLPVQDVPDLLSRLVERSMVETDAGCHRYRLLQTVRQYALDRLDESSDGDATRERHLACCLALCEAASAQLSGPDQAAWLERLDPEQENFLAAHAWCDRASDGAQAGLRLMFALKLYLFNRGLLAPLRWGLHDALRRPGALIRNSARCRALHSAGQVAHFMGRYAEAQVWLEEALGVAQDLADSHRAALVLQDLGMTCLGQGDRAAALRYLEQALALAAQRGDQRGHAAALNALAQWHRVEGALDVAEPLYEQGLSLSRQLGDPQSTAVALLNLAMVAIGRHAYPRAGGYLLETLDIAESIGSKPTGGNALAVSTGLAAVRGEWAQAARLYAAAQWQMSTTGLHLDPADEAFLEPLVARVRDAIPPRDFVQAEAAARELPYEQAMAAARAWLQAGSG